MQANSVPEAGIEVHEEVVLMTTKGEAIALGIAQMSTVELSSCDHGVVAKVKRCIMERDLYPRRWGLGPVALEKKKMKSDGKLDKYGRPNEATPAKWQKDYQDFNAPLDDTAGATITAKKPSETPALAGADPAEIPELQEKRSHEEAEDDGETLMKRVKGDLDVAAALVKVNGESKKRKHEGETVEEKAERKRKKKEKKEKKEKRKSKSKKVESDESSE